jgi:hypothetical protein
MRLYPTIKILEQDKYEEYFKTNYNDYYSLMITTNINIFNLISTNSMSDNYRCSHYYINQLIKYVAFSSFSNPHKGLYIAHNEIKNDNILSPINVNYINDKREIKLN